MKMNIETVRAEDVKTAQLVILDHDISEVWCVEDKRLIASSPVSPMYFVFTLVSGQSGEVRDVGINPEEPVLVVTRHEAG